MLEQFVLDELDKLFNVTIYNKEFCNLKPMYNRKDTKSRSRLNDNQETRVYENLYNFLNYSKVEMKNMVMVRDNYYKDNYLKFLKRALSNEKFNELYEKYEDEKLDSFGNSYLNSTLEVCDRPKYDKFNGLENDTIMDDSFILRNANDSYHRFMNYDHGLGITFFSKNAKKDVPNKIIQVNFESILALDVMVSDSLTKQWHKSIAHEDIPDMNIIFENIPEVMFLMCRIVYRNNNFGFFNNLKSIYPNFIKNNDVIEYDFELWKLLEKSNLLTSILNFKEILDRMDDSEIKIDESIYKLFKYNDIGFIADRNSDFNILDYTRRGLESTIGVLNSIIDKFDSLKSLDDVFKLTLSDVKVLRYHEFVTKLSNRALTSLKKHVSTDLDKLNDEIYRKMLGEKLFEVYKNMDVLEYNLINNLKYDERVSIKNIEEMGLDKIVDKACSLFEEGQIRFKINISNLDVRKLKDSSFKFLNSIVEKGDLKSIVMAPNKDSMEYFSKISLNEDLNMDIFKSNLEKIEKTLLSEFDFDIKENYSFCIVEFDNFNLRFRHNFNNNYSYTTKNAYLESFNIKNKELSNEDIATIFLFYIRFINFEDKNNLRYEEVDEDGSVRKLRILNSFYQMDSESLSKFLSLIFDSVNLSGGSEKIISEFFIGFYYSKFEYMSKEGKIEVDKFINLFSKIDFTEDFKRRFKKARSKHVVSSIFI
ncbi:hypothetical protein [Staphylococcus phage vB_StaM_SA1]|nr:hypothetical protein [Staphylococcus phage vB_StaM_SA1]